MLHTPPTVLSSSIIRHSTLSMRNVGVAASMIHFTRPYQARMLSSSPRRTIASSSSQQNSLTDATAHQKATGPHYRMFPPPPILNNDLKESPEDRATPAKPGVDPSELTKPSAASTVPTMVRGDWVLFHPVYSPEELKAVQVIHRERRTMSDSVAFGLVKLARTMFDWVSRYKHIQGPPDPKLSITELRKAGYLLDDKAWLNRILFLESIAGVPGMVAATLRHLTSLRLLRRDSGWIHTCLEEAENERMHLMTFMHLRNPGPFFRALILGAQGVFYNLFFLSYLISPRICHRFVGYLEEEAVVTYTRCIADLEAGRIPEWNDVPAPQIAIDYWRLPQGAKLLDVIYAVRSDETTHRFVNHSLANLDPSTDVNPFALREPDMHVKGSKIEFERGESERYVKDSHEIMQKQLNWPLVPSNPRRGLPLMDPASSSRSNLPTSRDNPDETPPAIHLHRRIFIGPMPEKLVSQTEAHGHKHHHRGIFLGRASTHRDDSDSSTNVSQLIKDHAFHHFMCEGGREEDWDEAEERGRSEALLQRWRESEWGALWHRRHRQRHGELRDQAPSRWVGGSFEVGHLLGVNVLDEPTMVEIPSQEEEPILSAPTPSSPTYQTGKSDAPTSVQDTFVTASSHFDAFPGSPEANGHTTPSPAASDTALLRSQKVANLSQAPRLKASTSQATSSSKVRDRGKKQVHYQEEVEEITAPGPASPTEVLNRTSATVEATTSAAASVQSSPASQDFTWGDVFLRDRMLLRVCTTKAENLNPNFDESMHRTTRDLQYQDWAEFVVAWRRDYIEIYADYTTTLQEWAVGHKHLAYIIPLKSPRTHLSLYSFVDMTFCITCRPMRATLNSKKNRWNLSTELDGTSAYIFKAKSRSRAYDWTWQLWRTLGGEIPKSIDIRNPRLGTKVAFELPALNLVDLGTAIKMLSRRNIIALCMKTLKPVPGWGNFVEHEHQRGRTLQLAWRSGAHVDWVWNDQNAEGEQREWSALCGLAFKNAPVLELRVAEHYPTFLNFKNGTPLVQPPAIEGYVERIRTNTQTKQSLYLVSHNGNLFTLSPQQAQPPSPPGAALMLGNMDEYKSTIMKVEIERGIYQLMHAHGVVDLRSVVAVRRAFQTVPQQHHDQKDDRLAEESSWFNVWSRVDERTNSDNEDEGGEEGLGKSDDKAYLRTKRSFELLLSTGRVVRFEVHSRRVANEWVERLRALVVYWKQRHRVNAKDEIDLAQAQQPRVTPQIRVCEEHEIPPENPDLSTPYPALDTLFNWCIIDGCRPIVKEGKLYMRKGFRGQFKLVQLFLVDGHLVSFRIGPHNSLHPANKKKINLIDAYVISGYLAALNLPKGQYRPNAPTVARRYEDGLEADDREEDMLFVICYRKHAAVIPQKPTITPVPGSTTNNNAEGTPGVPPLSEKHKLLVCKTRSKLERDGWCWALNVEIEKLTRKQKEREEKLRQTGNLRRLD
ncbi:hypothetical protein NP233_g5925 [Leucocoprinus birnbaumii]|uniref:Alternative oxidase n=1 Tax=Leucocoprinus birnbaumii TaxID=56174 RepID=A0AAD5VVF7_9AGAR|nr:hypothetical protein NP233_g5925 [Leucocoprinus birnbaumii]